MKKVYVRTFGCQMNEYDSDKMVDVLRAYDGYEKTTKVEDADLILFNTCSVREKAQEKVFSDLGRVRHLKELNPDVRIGVGGCVASQEGKVIMSRAPYVDLVFGPQTIHRLPSLLAERQKKGKSQIDISFPEVEKFDNLPTPITTSQSAMVSIMEGCSKYCTFCVVPYTRGEEISRPFEDVLVEVATLATQGVKEITLLGQNVNAYYHEQDNEAIDFATLLDYVSEVPGVERIRFTTSHPKEFSAALIDSYRKLPKLVDHVHLPVQSGSDRVLEAMKRGYTRADYIKIIDDLKLARSTVSISSDFIVGFPGETASDFDDTMSLVDEVNFDGSFSFMYSPRPGTPAAALPSHVPLPIKKQRLSQLQDKLSENAFRFNQRMIGSEYDVLVEGVSKKDPSKLSGRTNSNKVINFEGQERLIGHTVKIEVTEALPNSLRGNVITRD
ncbi:tRNA (N6-isopentenyl adenosine(37)-C2)-methylthiotransferase MiaB [Burkholderiales bacterium]|jgi:tRNA-2-methylthio-N6-dimethylallyladenosine synthase|nr:tRNA (N6-isopentenyl adenosine(37)-C2)-methylthiotransferase MiaB [Burkholderiales bacterium]MBT5949902.1 tRNA (N6-isopentenyl adenosine(37)-C2)-methylthiotransferase MiaB [Betaproteobacteria bacterium]MDA0361338.1 tRNA (N6-isopentenyl adenosine(37)-C2)-methylthiotransferase MiaB [Pseudomonadota bacterium]MBL6879083.1 tRNA (N6-isopentenyl adenosine(37)-C2)-methylthiotransferase MiaB [Burkholderiales bacterium]MCH1423496.1 tRNA (N6-isopentenyl adenosine(37)-C2)-methylthiotransferase MiaB [Bur